MHEPSGWLVEDGVRELEQLFRAVLSRQSEPILIVDGSRHCLYASSGAGKLLGLSMGRLIGRRIDDLIPLNKPQPNKLDYTVNSDVLPGRHVWVLRSGPVHEKSGAVAKDYALLSLDSSGLVVAWYSGAERIYGYKSAEIVGQHVSCLDLADEAPPANSRAELKRTAIEGHLGNEGWHRKQDGSRFWANVLTSALRDENQELRGLPG
jgi:PAS domain S-box-containing protein